MTNLVILKPKNTRLFQKVVKTIQLNNIHLRVWAVLKFTKEQIRILYQHQTDKPFYAEIEKYMTSDPCIIMLAEGDCMGLYNAKKHIRERFATDRTHNVIHIPDQNKINQEIQFIKSIK